MRVANRVQLRRGNDAGLVRSVAMSLGIVLISLVAGVALGAPSATTSFVANCRDAARGIPPRLPDAVGGSEFSRRVLHIEGAARDAEVRAELLRGDLPERLRKLAPVALNGVSAAGEPVGVTLCVMPDYLAVGSDEDSLLMPMGLPTALDIAARFGFSLPTARIVDAIYEAAPVQLIPEPLPPGDLMRTTMYIVQHDELIRFQRALQLAPDDALSAGHKKDLVLTDRKSAVPGRVAIYGWHRAQGQPIQPLSMVHGERYADYSHGVRLVGATAYVNGTARAIEEVLADPNLAVVLLGSRTPRGSGR